MERNLEKAIRLLSQHMRTMKGAQQAQVSTDSLNEREEMILEFLNEKGPLSVSEIAAAEPNVSFSTISTDITKLWREKQMVSKTVDPKNQRTTIVELTEKGKKTIKLFEQHRAERLKALLQAINVTSKEKQTLLTILQRAIEFFDKYKNSS